MNSNCALRNLYSDSLLQKVEINLGGGVRFLAISLSESKPENNCIVDFVRRLLLSIREGLLFVCAAALSVSVPSFCKAISDFSFANVFSLKICSNNQISKQKKGGCYAPR